MELYLSVVVRENAVQKNLKTSDKLPIGKEICLVIVSERYSGCVLIINNVAPLLKIQNNNETAGLPQEWHAWMHIHGNINMFLFLVISAFDNN